MTRDEMDAAIKATKRGTFGALERDEQRAIFLAGMRAAADIAEQAWKDGYHGETNSGFKYAILRVANRLSIES